VTGLNALLAIVSTPSSARVIAAAQLRKGSTNSAKGAARLVADALVEPVKLSVCDPVVDLAGLGGDHVLDQDEFVAVGGSVRRRPGVG